MPVMEEIIHQPVVIQPVVAQPIVSQQVQPIAPQMPIPETVVQPIMAQSTVVQNANPAVISPNESLLNSRDMLVAKARAFKESQDLKSKHGGPEQLSMMMESESAQLEEARKMARDVLSSSFHGQNLDVPSFIRKRQSMEQDNKPE